MKMLRPRKRCRKLTFSEPLPRRATTGEFFMPSATMSGIWAVATTPLREASSVGTEYQKVASAQAEPYRTRTNA